MNLKFDIYARQLDRDIPVHMYLPDNYMNEQKDYPVLYMFDGHNLFFDEDATFGRSWRLAGEIRDHFPNLIVAGIECSHNGNDRLSEYAPYDYYDQILQEPVKGRGNQTLDFIIHDLKPYIDMHFPTRPERSGTWIGGSSCGGFMAMYALYACSKVFSKALCLSPFIIYSQSQLLTDLSRRYIRRPSSFYISWGAREGSRDHEFVEETKVITEVSNILLRKGAHLEFNMKLYGRHCEEDWQAEAGQFLEFLK
ncbi:MAG: alpha/beta hydrolase [Erysipelotrichaceae bacterium]|nr:alpha/beta hydrolase [Erysipelotrichaceae bacterium]